MIGIFARANHPQGWGLPNGKAHGWVIFGVSCKSRKELDKVVERLNIDTYKRPFLGLATHYYEEGHLADWYGGGPFDLVFIVPGNKIDFGSPYMKLQDRRFQSVGDNRFVGLYTAAEVLEN